MAYHEQYILRVTAGATYDTSKHEDVHVNTERPITVSSDLIDAKIHHPYDRYSIGFSFTPKKTIAGHHLVFGNDFDHPIRDRLPPLFDKAFGIVKWWIDPGLEGDVYGEEPYLYGALLSSINVLRIGSKGQTTLEQKTEEEEDTVVYQEGAEGDGIEVREEQGIPSDARQRQKYFLAEQRRKDFDFEAGREYMCDFFNPYLDFNEFALKIGYGLPPISIIGHWDGQPLRYVLKDRSTNTELFVVIFQLIPTEEAKDDGVKSSEEVFEEVHKAEGKDEGAGGDEDLD